MYLLETGYHGLELILLPPAQGLGLQGICHPALFYVVLSTKPRAWCVLGDGFSI